MKRSAILTLFVGYCVFCFSQELSFSNKFETIKRSVPLAIINSQKDYFHLLRYNKVLHDFTLERRSKPHGAMTGFTPLKLDLVNADWFNYENLDYLFYEQHKNLYFIFEKVLNYKRTVYLKVIDTLNHSSEFIEVAVVEKEKAAIDFDLKFKMTFNKNILIITSQTYANSVKKTVSLYNIQTKKTEWIKKLPLENIHTGYSDAFECSSTGDLCYVLIKSHIESYERKYVNHTQMQMPVFYYDTLTLVNYSDRNKGTITRKTVLSNVSRLNSLHVSTNNNDVLLHIHYAVEMNDSKDKRVFFLNAKFSTYLNDEVYYTITELKEKIKEQLTFYDGTDSKYAGDKHYEFLNSFVAGNVSYQVSQRKDENYYKELLVCEVNLATGQMISQSVIPRKTYIFKGRTRLKNIGEAMPVVSNEALGFVLLEAPSNLKRAVSDFDFHRFKKENNLWNSNIVMYTIDKDGGADKKMLYHNSDLDLVPLYYQNNGQADMIFYLSNGKSERFATLKLNPF